MSETEWKAIAMHMVCNKRQLACLVRSMAVATVISLLGSLSVSAQAKSVNYACQDGIVLGAVFDNQAETLTLTFSGGAAILLKQAISGSGVRFQGGGYELYGKADWENVIRSGHPELRCQESAAKAPAPRGKASATAPSFSCQGSLNATENRLCSNAAL